MPRPQRSEQFDPGEVCIVHVVQRCVRRAFLAGVDQVSGIDYSFRKEWIRRRMEALASVFAVDVLSYAVMSNHMHQILRNRPDVCASWSDEEVAIRWLRVFPGRRLEEHLAEPTENDVKTLCRDKRTSCRDSRPIVGYLVVYASVRRTDRADGQQAGRVHRPVLGRTLQVPADRR